MKTYDVKCRGDTHRIGIAAATGKLLALDHDVDAEEIAMQLGAKEPICLRALRAISPPLNQSRFGMSLMWSATTDQPGLVELVIDLWDGHCERTILDAVLYEASKEGHADVVAALLKHGASAHLESIVPLSVAAGLGHLDVVKLLAEDGADVEAEDNNAVVQAARHGHIEVVRYLMTRGARITDKDIARLTEIVRKL